MIDEDINEKIMIRISKRVKAELIAEGALKGLKLATYIREIIMTRTKNDIKDGINKAS